VNQVSLPCGWAVRSLRDEDYAGICALVAARSRMTGDGATFSREDLERWLNRPRFDREKDVLIVVDVGDTVVGMASVDNEGEPFTSVGIGVSIHPDHQENEQAWDALGAWCLKRASEIAERAEDDVRVVTHGQALPEDAARRATLERAGFEVVRVFNRMGIDLGDLPPEPDWPDGITWRIADIEADEGLLIGLYQETFRDHWGHVERPREVLVQAYRMQMQTEGDLFDPSLQMLALDGDDVAGLVIARRHIGQDTSKGFIYLLGVRPAWRRRGLGLALLQHGFAELHRRGLRHVELDMDSESLTGALRLYERAGMHAVRQTIRYEKEVRSGVDLATRTLDQ